MVGHRVWTLLTFVLVATTTITAAPTSSATSAGPPPHAKEQPLHPRRFPPPGISRDGNKFAGLTFDYVIVGGGTAGLVLANRLSADPSNSVAVIEAGEAGLGDTSLTTPDAMLYNSSVGTDKDWKYRTTSQSGLGGRSVYWPRGKVLGGSSAINGMYLVRQPKVEQDAWTNLLESLGPEAQRIWGWDNVLNAMKKSEKFDPPLNNIQAQIQAGAPHRRTSLLPYNQQSHGHHGQVHHGWPGQEFASVGAFLQTAQSQLSMPINSDPYGGYTSGPWLSMSSINSANWTRSFARTAYLDPIARPNLHVLTNHQTTKILFDTFGPQPRATGIQCAESEHDWVHTIHASKEVILSAGVIGSAQLLQLSGVASRQVLDPVGIQQVANVPGVGYHLQDHLSGAVTFSAKSGVSMPPTKVTGNAVQDSYVNSAVAYTPLSKLIDNKNQIVNNITNSIDEWVDAYDAPTQVKAGYRAALEQLAHTIYGNDAPAVEILWSISFGSNHVQCGLQHPSSQGSVKITSSSPWDHPQIDAAYVHHEVDLQVLRQGCQLARKIGSTAPLSSYTGRETSPGASVQTAEQWNQYIQKSFGTEYHPSSTNSLLPYEYGGVVDERLRVYGVENLRVVDSSVVPLSFSQHLMTITYGLAEIGAELILEDNSWNDW